LEKSVDYFIPPKQWFFDNSKWAVFEVIGPIPQAMQDMWKRIYTEWLPSSGFEHAAIPALEVYTNENPNNQDYYTEIWIPVK
jgi:AraC family transcriptional regulator